MTTDEDGEFHWTDAPQDSVWIHVACAGFFASTIARYLKPQAT